MLELDEVVVMALESAVEDCFVKPGHVLAQKKETGVLEVAGVAYKVPNEIIESYYHKRTYSISRKFLKIAGIEGKLDHGSIMPDPFDLGFKLSDDGEDDIFFYVDPDRKIMSIEYSRTIALTNREMLERADIQTTIQKIAANNGLEFKPYCTTDDSVGEPSIRMVMLKGEFPIRNYAQYAEIVGFVDKMIALYLGKNKFLQNKPVVPQETGEVTN